MRLELLGDVRQALHQLLDHDWRKAERELIDQQQRRPAQQRHSDCEHLLLAAAEVAGELCLALSEAREVAEDAILRDLRHLRVRRTPGSRARRA